MMRYLRYFSTLSLCALIAFVIGIEAQTQSSSSTTSGQTTTSGKKETIAKPLTEKEKKKREEKLRKELETPYKRWLEEDVAYIITDEERKSFKTLATDD